MRRLLVFVVLFALCGWLATGLAQVRPEERAVVRRFGRVVAQPGPGLWVGLPVGIDRVDRVRLSTIRQLEVGMKPELLDDPTTPGQYLTGDQNLVSLRVVVEYVVNEAELVSFILQQDRLELLLTREVEACLSDWTAGVEVDRALLAGRSMLPAWLVPRLKERLAPLNLGILVQRVTCETIVPPAEVRPAFEAVNQAQIAAGTRENEARLDAARRIRESETKAFQLARQAEVNMSAKLSAATAEADAFTKRLAQYRVLVTQNPHILETIWWNEMNQVFTSLRARGRVDLLDAYLGPTGLDVTQFLTPKKK